MSRLRSVSRWLKDRVYDRSYEPVQITDRLYDTLTDRLPDRDLIRVSPHREGEGIEAGKEFVTTLHNIRTGKFGFKNVSRTRGFEIWYDNSSVNFYLVPEDDEDDNRLRNQIGNKYPKARIQSANKSFPLVRPNEFVAGGVLQLRKPFYFPIKTSRGEEEFESDPFGSITSEMVIDRERIETAEGKTVTVDGDDLRVVVQVMFTPAKKKWSTSRPWGVDCEKVGNHIKEEGQIRTGLKAALTGNITVDPSKSVRRTGDLIASQRGDEGFYCRVRVLCISPYEKLAKRRARSVAEIFKSHFNSVTEQGFTPKPVHEDQLEELAIRVAGRRFDYGAWEKLTSQNKMILTPPELADIVHIPNEEINTPGIDFAEAPAGAGVPTDSTQTEDVTNPSAAKVEQQSDDTVVVNEDGIDPDEVQPALEGEAVSSTVDGQPAIEEQRGAGQSDDPRELPDPGPDHTSDNQRDASAGGNDNEAGFEELDDGSSRRDPSAGPPTEPTSDQDAAGGRSDQEQDQERIGDSVDAGETGVSGYDPVVPGDSSHSDRDPEQLRREIIQSVTDGDDGSPGDGETESAHDASEEMETSDPTGPHSASNGAPSHLGPDSELNRRMESELGESDDEDSGTQPGEDN